MSRVSGTPVLRSLFNHSIHASPRSAFYGYANGDILLSRDVIDTLRGLSHDVINTASSAEPNADSGLSVKPRYHSGLQADSVECKNYATCLNNITQADFVSCKNNSTRINNNVLTLSSSLKSGFDSSLQADLILHKNDSACLYNNAVASPSLQLSFNRKTNGRFRAADILIIGERKDCRLHTKDGDNRKRSKNDDGKTKKVNDFIAESAAVKTEKDGNSSKETSVDSVADKTEKEVKNNKDNIKTVRDGERDDKTNDGKITNLAGDYKGNYAQRFSGAKIAWRTGLPANSRSTVTRFPRQKNAVDHRLNAIAVNKSVVASSRIVVAAGNGNRNREAAKVRRLPDCESPQLFDRTKRAPLRSAQVSLTLSLSDMFLRSFFS